MNWIKIKRGCSMPDLDQTVLVMLTTADLPTCAVWSRGRHSKPSWVYDQSWDDVETDDGTQVTHWCAVELPKE